MASWRQVECVRELLRRAGYPDELIGPLHRYDFDLPEWRCGWVRDWVRDLDQAATRALIARLSSLPAREARSIPLSQLLPYRRLRAR